MKRASGGNQTESRKRRSTPTFPTIYKHRVRVCAESYPPRGSVPPYAGLSARSYEVNRALNLTVSDGLSFVSPLFEAWLLRVALEPKPEGNGEEIREYIHVQDAAKLSVDILGDEYRNRRIIIAGNEQIKVKDLLTMMKEILKGEVDIEFIPAKQNNHYEITPYVFNPQIATKMRGKEHLDMGQGILNILSELHRKHVVCKTDNIAR